MTNDASSQRQLIIIGEKRHAIDSKRLMHCPVHEDASLDRVIWIEDRLDAEDSMFRTTGVLIDRTRGAG